MSIRKFRAKTLPTFIALEIPATVEGFKEELDKFIGHLPVQVAEYPVVDQEGKIGFQIYDSRNNGILNVITGDFLVLDDESQELNAFDESFPHLADEIH